MTLSVIGVISLLIEASSSGGKGPLGVGLLRAVNKAASLRHYANLLTIIE